MRRPPRPGPSLAAAALALGGVTLVGASVARGIQEPQDFRDSPFLRIDPERIVLSERDNRVPCGECHEAEYEVWVETPHATGFETMHRTESARSILRALGLRVTKRQESLCMRCHYTVKAPELQAIAGVSCESCHGPARDWIDIHNDWGPGVEHPDQEDPQHRAQRVEAATDAGMLRPSGDLYAVAANCFECHTVPFEELVNEGGHKAGSGSFDLVEWSERIRHNFVHRQWGGEGGNREPSQERKRAMLLVDRILKYEFGLRGVAVATVEGSYQKAMERRTTGAYEELDAIARIVELPELVDIVEIGADLDLVPGNEEALTAAADRIREVARAFTPGVESMDLAALDPLLQGAPAQVVAARAAGPADPQQVGAAEAAPAEAAATPAEGAPAEGEGEPAAAEAPAGPPELPGSVRSRPAWFPDFDHEYAESPDCGGCHEGAADWIYDDPHGESNAALINQTPRAREIATLYGIGAAGMTKGDQLCMNCHGTARAATAVDVYESVTCESCHGPAADFEKPHKKGGNPQLGMRNLKDAGARAENCSRCHHITDERLLATGHPSGDDYDLASASDAIRHWPDDDNLDREGPYPAVDPSALASAWSSAVSGRPVPSVTVVALPSRPAPRRTAAPPAAGGGGERAAPEPAAEAGPPAPSRPAVDTKPRGAPPVRSVAPRPPARRPTTATRSGQSVELEPLPEGTDSLTAEALLQLVQSRLERLYRILGRSGGGG
ncbi:MAG: multiheme c-type cytochrome [Gemmatimonadota bacterium]